MGKSLPIVAIVGRTNVGKSSLFNAILGRREAIVAVEEGTTRDSIYAKAQHNGHQFWLVDTAGVKTPEDDFEFTIQEQIAQASDSADVIWVVIEAAVAISDEDRRLAKMALKTKKPVFLVVNKADQNRSAVTEDFLRLGIKPVLLTSATQRSGLSELLDELVSIIPAKSETEADDRIRIAILGRPNVGKSALFNTLAKKQQAIVADRAGTTRDVNHITVKFEGRELELLDTAGIRRSGKIEVGIEKFSVIRALAAIEQADVCLLLIDSSELSVQLDQKIAGMIKEAGKGLIIVVSKWDLGTFGKRHISVKILRADAQCTQCTSALRCSHFDQTAPSSESPNALEQDEEPGLDRDQVARRVAYDFDFVPWAPLIFTSSVTGQNVTKIFELVLEIAGRRQLRVKTPELNRWLGRVTHEHPPAGLKNRAPKLNYITQEQDNPVPSFKVFGSHTKFLHWGYKRFMERRLREEYDLVGTAVQFWFIEKHQDRHKVLKPKNTEY